LVRRPARYILRDTHAVGVKTRFDVMTIRGWRADRDQDPR
jgi:hypothetical protein